MSQKRRYITCFERRRQDQRVWAVLWRGHWLLTHHVDQRTRTFTVYAPHQKKPKPSAWIEGLASSVTRLEDGSLRIS